MRKVIFFDNHDMARFYSVVNEDVVKYKSALTWLLTCRGIPQIYYGDEIGLTGFTSPNDGHVRQDFPVDGLQTLLISLRSRGAMRRRKAYGDTLQSLPIFARLLPRLLPGK